MKSHLDDFSSHIKNLFFSVACAFNKNTKINSEEFKLLIDEYKLQTLNYKDDKEDLTDEQK